MKPPNKKILNPLILGNKALLITLWRLKPKALIAGIIVNKNTVVSTINILIEQETLMTIIKGQNKLKRVVI